MRVCQRGRTLDTGIATGVTQDERIAEAVGVLAVEEFAWDGDIGKNLALDPNIP